MSARDGGETPGEYLTIGQRLRQAIERRPPRGRERGVRMFQRDMEERAKEIEAKDERLPGVTLPSIMTYLNDKTEPSLAFLREAAQLLNVRLEWLVTGEEPMTEREEKLEAARSSIQAATDPLRHAVHRSDAGSPQAGGVEASRGALMDLLTDIVQAAPHDDEYTDDDLARLASLLHRFASDPINVLAAAMGWARQWGQLRANAFLAWRSIVPEPGCGARISELIAALERRGYGDRYEERHREESAWQREMLKRRKHVFEWEAQCDLEEIAGEEEDHGEA